MSQNHYLDNAFFIFNILFFNNLLIFHNHARLTTRTDQIFVHADGCRKKQTKSSFSEDPLKFVKPPKKALNFPSSFVSTQAAPILGPRFLAVFTVGRDEFNSLASKGFIKRIVSRQEIDFLLHGF